MRIVIATLLLLTAFAGSGCITVNAALPGTLRADVPDSDIEKIGELKIEKSNWFFLYGLIGAPDEKFFSEDITKAVQAKGGDGVANLRYESQEGCVDWGLTRCTLFIIVPRTYTLTGDIVRIKKAPLPGKPAKVADAPMPSSVKTAEAVVPSQQF